MFYISLVFILTGLLLFAFSVISGSLRQEEKPAKAPSGRAVNGDDLRYSSKRDSVIDVSAAGMARAKTVKDSHVDVEEPAREVKKLFLEKDEEGIDDNVPEVFSDIDDETETSENLPGDDVPAGSARATLFDDSSTVMDYQHKRGSIDPTLEEYRNIKRIGHGSFSIEKEGISFKIGSRLFRFDYHKLEQMFTGDNFVALKIRGKEEKKLFIFEKGRNIIPEIKNNYDSFLSFK